MFCFFVFSMMVTFARAEVRCNHNFIIGANSLGYPTLIEIPGSPRTSLCNITIKNEDSYEHSITPVDGTMSPFYFGGIAIYPLAFQGLRLPNDEHILVGRLALLSLLLPPIFLPLSML